MKLKEEFIRLLEKDKEFRYLVAGILGYRDILERLEEHDKKFNEILKKLDEHTQILSKHDRKFNEILKRLEEHTRILSEHTKRLEEHDRKFNEIMKTLEEHTKRFEEHDRKFNEILKKLDEHSRRFEEHDRKFNEILKKLEEHDKKFEEISYEMRDLRDRVEVTIGSMGRRWGTDLERTVLRIFRKILMEKGIEPRKVEKFRYIDKDGSITGIKDRIIDVDILIQNKKLYLIEVKSRTDIDQVYTIPQKAKILEKILKRKVDKQILVTVNIDKEALQQAQKLKIETIYGHIIK